MRVSVIIAAYNCEQTIERALTSVLNQTKPVTEVIVVDDASTDGTVALVAEMAAADPRIVLLKAQQNGGPAAARNLGLKAARADWVAILDADDAWSPNRVQVFAETVERFDVDIVADNQFLYDVGAEKVTRLGFSPRHGVRWIEAIDVFEQDVQLGAEFSYGILKPIIRRSFIESRNVSYDGEIRYGEDLLFLGEMLISGARALIIPTPHYIYTTRVGDESKVVSPHSRSTPRFDLFAGGIEALEAKYGVLVADDLGEAMQRLAARFRRVHQANVARDKRHRNGLAAYALHLLQRPPVLAQVMRQRAAYARRVGAAKLDMAWRVLNRLSGRRQSRAGGLPARLREMGMQFLTALAFALPVVALTTLVRGLLATQLMSQSPFMIYVAAVVAATLLVGPLCGALVTGGGALAGLYFFAAPAWSWQARPADDAAMLMFCAVSLSVLLPIAALRRQLLRQKTSDAQDDLSVALSYALSPWAAEQQTTVASRPAARAEAAGRRSLQEAGRVADEMGRQAGAL